MSQRFGADCLHAVEHHVAQQSRRDKLRHQFLLADNDPSPSSCSNSNVLVNSSNMMVSGVLDFAGNNPSSSPPCDWIIMNQHVEDNHHLVPSSQLYRHDISTPIESQQQITFQNTLEAMVTSSASLPSAQLGLELAGQVVPWIDPRQQQVKLEGGLALSLAPKPGRFDVGLACHNQPRFLVGDAGRGVGPLGPFTGYAAILKSSKFLRPAQQLLDEFCSTLAGSSKLAKLAHTYYVPNRVGEGKSLVVSHCDGPIGDDATYSVKRDNSGGSSSSLYSSMGSGRSGEGHRTKGSGTSCSIQRLDQPEIHQKKVKLLYLQEEVCRRYKQYHQQMQMVVSSFESVAGLSAATPYTCMALKAISKQFRSVKHVISNQLRYVCRVLGEDLMSSPSSSSRGETATAMPRLRYIDQSLRKLKSNENTSLGFLDNNQPVWRPQRGLPERAVSVLRAWLFEHFLHPYPSDTDKHMLASQTGLTRNQVSNWFINARVRLWKPMVEEIHMLESKGTAEMDLNSSNKTDGKSSLDDGGRQPYSEKFLEEAQSSKSLRHSSPMNRIANESSSISMEQWHCEKRSRMEECAIPGSMDGGLMSLAYQGGMALGGLGSVSLTLGLRQNDDPQQELEMRHFGSQMLHDFVG